MTFDEVRAIALALPGVEEASSYGTPGLKCRGKLLARLWENGEVLVITRVGLDERDFLIDADPDTFFTTDHYRGYPIVLAYLAKLAPESYRTLLLRAWFEVASKAQLKQFAEQTQPQSQTPDFGPMPERNG